MIYQKLIFFFLFYFLAIGIEAYIGKQQKARAKKALNMTINEKVPITLLDAKQSKKLT